MEQNVVQYCNKANTTAGSLVEEPKEEITLERNLHLLCDKVHLHLLELLFQNPLDFELQDFQKVAVHVLGSRQNCILVSPTGSGKMLVVYLAILVLEKVNGLPGVGIGTQPLNAIMQEKMREAYISTGIISMQGDIKHSEERDNVFLSDPAGDFKAGKVKCVIGHAESWTSEVA